MTNHALRATLPALLAALLCSAPVAVAQQDDLTTMMVIRYDPDRIRLTPNLLDSLCRDTRWHRGLLADLEKIELPAKRVQIQVMSSETEQPPGVFAGQFELQLHGVKEGTTGAVLRGRALQALARRLGEELTDRLTHEPAREADRIERRLRKEIEVLRHMVEKLTLDLPPAAKDETEQQRLADELARTEVELKTHEAKQLRMQEYLARFEAELADMLAERQTRRVELEELAVHLADLQTRLAQPMDEAKRKQIQTELEDLKALSSAASARLDQLAQLREMAQTQFADMTKQSQQSLLRGHDLQAGVAMLRDRLALYDAQRDERADQQRKRVRLEGELRTARTQLDELTDRLAAVREKSASMRAVTVEVW